MLRKLLPVVLLATSAGAAEFEAVSIKPSPSESRGSGHNISRGRLQGKNQTLRDIVAFAWSLQSYQLSGGARWAGSDHYEIVATFPGDTPESECKQMLQTMLADRFELKVHKESKSISGYALAVGRAGVQFPATTSGQPSMVMSPAPDPGQRRLAATSWPP